MTKKKQPTFQLITSLDVRFKFNTPAKTKAARLQRLKMNQTLRKITREIKSKVQTAVIQEYNRISVVPISIKDKKEKENVE